VITHDTAIAERAERQLQMRDGELLAPDDETKLETVSTERS
jgi:ABC-type lipoprotein export system ATPase subunit